MAKKSSSKMKKFANSNLSLLQQQQQEREKELFQQRLIFSR